MPDDRACRSTVIEKTEPPSRRSQRTFVEALTTALIDGNLSSLLSILCSRTRFPFVILIGGHLCAILLSFLYGKEGILLIAEHLNVTTQDGLIILFSMVVQGIGYCFAEVVHVNTSRYVRKAHEASNNRMILIMTKNISFIALSSSLQIIANSPLLIDFAYGALYAVIIGTLHDIVYETPLLNYIIAHITGYLINVTSWTAQAARHKYTVRLTLFCVLIYIGLITNNLYATHQFLTNTSAYIMFFAYTLGLFEQTLVYEYAYRATYYVYRSWSTNYFFIRLNSIINHIKPKNLEKPTISL